MTAEPGHRSWDGGRSAEDPAADGRTAWIEDDGLLRDEGALFGLAGADDVPESKIEAIREYYRALSARGDADRRLLLEERGRLERRSDELHRRIADLEQRRALDGAPDHGREVDAEARYRPPGEAQPDAQSEAGPRFAASSAPRPMPEPEPEPEPELDADPGLGRYIAGGLLALATCAFAYFVVLEILGGTAEHPRSVALAVTLAGLFLVYTPVSLLYTHDDRHRSPPWGNELWKARLAEFGMPAAAALFVVAWGETGGWLRGAGAFVFLTMLFLVAGRLLLSLVTRTGALLAERRERGGARGGSTAVDRLRDRAERLDQRIAGLRERLSSIPTVDELEARSAHKIALLRSEFELARSSREPRTGHTDIDLVPTHAGQEGA